MILDPKQTITITEASQIFPRAAQMADENGSVLILQNNRPQYKLINLDVEPDLQLTDDEKIDIVARRVMKRFKPAFLELANR